MATSHDLLRIFIVSNILGYVLVNGRPEGAPATACEDGTNIVPVHVPNSPSTSPVPYSVDICDIPSSGYVPGQNYTIILRGSPADQNFRGFMIQGRVCADDSPAGTFGSGTNYQPQCSGDTAATHTQRNNKRTVNLVWTAPPAGTGCICFRHAFVDVYATFWANLTIPCVSEDFLTALAKFKDIEYSVVEGERMFRVELEKVGTTAETVTLSIQFRPGTAMSRSDYPVFQPAQAVMIPPGPSIDIPVDLTINDDDIVECNETFTLELVSLDTVRLQIDPARDQATVTIIDDDVTTVAFPGSAAINEGNTGPVEVAYLGTIAQSFMVTVESYQCDGNNAASPGVDYEPVNVRLTFTPTLRSQIVNVITIDDDIFEDYERICLRLTNLTEPCPDSVTLGNDTEVIIYLLTFRCYTNTTGNSIIGQTVSLFYSSAAIALFFPQFQCALNDRALESCDDPSTVYGPLSYGYHTVTVKAKLQSAIPLQEITITHEVLMVQARLCVINSSAIQISIQSTKDAIYRCRLSDSPYFTCNDGDVVGGLSLTMYILMLMVEATTTTGSNPPQHASDIHYQILLL